MAAGLSARFAAGADPEFQKRVAQALAETAVTIYGENPATAGHAARAAYAVVVVTDPPMAMVINGSDGILQADKRTFAVARILTTLGIDNTSTDAAILTGVAQVWSALAGA